MEGLLNIILFNFTHFEKNITIKQKYLRSPYRKADLYMIVDNNNTIYELNNTWWKFDFNRAEKWSMLEINNMYKVKGYGFRIPIFNMYPNIYYVSNIMSKKY